MVGLRCRWGGASELMMPMVRTVHRAMACCHWPSVSKGTWKLTQAPHSTRLAYTMGACCLLAHVSMHTSSRTCQHSLPTWDRGTAPSAKSHAAQAPV